MWVRSSDAWGAIQPSGAQFHRKLPAKGDLVNYIWCIVLLSCF